MSKSYTIAEAAEQLGITTSALRQRIYTGTVRGSKTQKGWRVYLNGDEAVAEQPPEDALMSIADELISLGKRLKKAIKEHDAEVRRESIVDFATTLAETVEKGR